GCPGSGASPPAGGPGQLQARARGGRAHRAAVGRPMRAVDINADVGEGGDDEALFPYLTSVSIACGGHAGDDATMRLTLSAAAAHGLRLGAHPGYPDRDGFGRVDLDLSAHEVRETVAQQVAALRSMADQLGLRLTHVKAHGALYNRAWTDAATAAAVAEAVLDVDPALH